MQMPTDYDILLAKLAGVIGSIVSMRFIQGTWAAKFLYAGCGSAISFYGAPTFSTKTSLPEGLAGFLLGLFGMAIAAKIHDWLRSAPVDILWQIMLDWLKRLFGKATP